MVSRGIAGPARAARRSFRAAATTTGVFVPFPLSVSLAGLHGNAGTDPAAARDAINTLAGMGWRALQLDGTVLRARELDRSARRDLAALFRRLDLGFSGLDLWIPPAHFADAARSDRAVAAVEAGAVLASELASLVHGSSVGAHAGGLVSLTLPADCPEAMAAHLAGACQIHGVLLADHAWPARAAPGAMGTGIDPASIIFAGADPAAEVPRLAAVPVAARLDDLAASGRVEVGSELGRLDRATYEAALYSRGFRGYLVADLRGLPDPIAAARRLRPTSDASARPR